MEITHPSEPPLLHEQKPSSNRARCGPLLWTGQSDTVQPSCSGSEWGPCHCFCWGAGWHLGQPLENKSHDELILCCESPKLVFKKNHSYYSCYSFINEGLRLKFPNKALGWNKLFQRLGGPGSSPSHKLCALPWSAFEQELVQSLPGSMCGK